MSIAQVRLKNWLGTCGIITLSMPQTFLEFFLSIILTTGRPNEATHIFFIGVGDAFYGVANLLINRGAFHPQLLSYVHRS